MNTQAGMTEKPNFRMATCTISQSGLERSTVCRDMIDHMGLTKFILYKEVPKLDRQQCLSFLATYDPALGSGIINDRDGTPVPIVIDAELVHKVTGLPLGNPSAATFFSPDNEILRKLFPGGKRRFQEYYLEEVVYAEDEEDLSKEFFDIAIRLQEKLLCKTTHIRYAGPELMVGMYWALSGNVTLQWAAFMASALKAEAMKAKVSSCKDFGFGCWLTGMIQHTFREKKLKLPRNSKRGPKRQTGGSSIVTEDKDDVPAQEKIPQDNVEVAAQEKIPQVVPQKTPAPAPAPAPVQQQQERQVTRVEHADGKVRQQSQLRLSELQGELRVLAVELKHARADADKLKEELQRVKAENAELQNVKLQNMVLESEISHKRKQEKMMGDLVVQLRSKLAARKFELREKQAHVDDMLFLTKNPMEAILECVHTRAEKRNGAI